MSRSDSHLESVHPRRDEEGRHGDDEADQPHRADHQRHRPRASELQSKNQSCFGFYIQVKNCTGMKFDKFECIMHQILADIKDDRVL